VTEDASGSRPSDPPLEVLVSLYGIEAGLIQQKASHVLTIRSIAMATFTGILAAVAIYPGRQIELLTLILVPFYVLDSVYDAYLIPIVQRETNLRGIIASVLAKRGAPANLVSAYRAAVDHRVTPERWSPFWRAALEPIRVLFYAALVLIPPIVVALSPHS